MALELLPLQYISAIFISNSGFWPPHISPEPVLLLGRYTTICYAQLEVMIYHLFSLFSFLGAYFHFFPFPSFYLLYLLFSFHFSSQYPSNQAPAPCPVFPPAPPNLPPSSSS